MYHPFFQFVLPRLGQVALDALLYLNFLQLPPLQLVARWPVLYYGLPLVLMGVLAYISRDPLGLGIVFAGHLVTFYCIGTAIGLALRRIGGTPLTVWRYLAGWHNAVAVDGPYHVVGAAACAASLYDKIQPYNAEKSAERQADHRAGQ